MPTKYVKNPNLTEHAALLSIFCSDGFSALAPIQRARVAVALDQPVKGLERQAAIALGLLVKPTTAKGRYCFCDLCGKRFRVVGDDGNPAPHCPACRQETRSARHGIPRHSVMLGLPGGVHA